jgi:hypothetical protein
MAQHPPGGADDPCHRRHDSWGDPYGASALGSTGRGVAAGSRPERRRTMAMLRSIRALPLLILLVATACDVRITIVEVHQTPAPDKGASR